MTTTERPPQLAVLPDPSGLLAAIISNPEADDPRLQYADWLDEQGDSTVGCRACRETGWQHERPATAAELLANPVAFDSEGAPVYRRSCKACSGTGAVLNRTNSLRAEYIRLALSARTSADINRLLAAFHQTVGLLMPSGRDHCEPGVCMGRGFIKWLPCSWEWWFKNGDALRAKEWVPLVRLSSRPLHRWFGKWDDPNLFMLEIIGLPNTRSMTREAMYLIGEEKATRSTMHAALSDHWPGTSFMFSSP